MSYRGKAKNFWSGLGITLLSIGALVGLGFILDATIPACHNAFVTAINWVKGL